MSKGMMSFETFTRLWEKSFKQYNGEIGFYNWGESFLNSDLPRMVHFAKSHSRTKLLLNSNFSFNNDDRLVETLGYLTNDLIVISCDGFSQETCEKYRVDVEFDRVMHNIDLIVRHKNPSTQVHWQYLKFPWNSAEQTDAKNYCKAKKIEFYPGSGGITHDYPMLPNPRKTRLSNSRCISYLYSLTINYDGNVYPCCAYYGPVDFSLGNAAEKSLEWIFTQGKGREMIDYLTHQSPGHAGIYCKHCIERDTALLETWKNHAI